MRPSIGALLFSAAVLLLASIPAAASVSYAVTAAGSVVSNCTAVTATGTTYNIGTYDTFTNNSGNPLKNTTPLTLSTNCTLGDTGASAIKWTVGIGSHCGLGTTAGDRAMTDGSSHYLSYELYPDNTFNPTTQWSTNSCGTPPSASQTSNGLTVTNSVSLYGEVPGGQNAAQGTYNDTVVVTLSY